MIESDYCNGASVEVSIEWTPPIDLPYLVDLDFEVTPGKFKFEREVVLEKFREICQLYKTASKSKLDLLEGIEEIEKLVKVAVDQGLNSVAVDAKLLWSRFGGVALELAFLDVFCEQCGVKYGSDQVSVKTWEQRNGYALLGGKKVVCPKGHCLYAIWTWES